MQFKPMLAATIEPSEIKHEMMVSVKLEGVRGELLNGSLVTRALKPFNNPLLTQKYAQAAALCQNWGIVLEGEFYKHGLTFKEIDSFCRNSKKTEDIGLEFHIFDCFIPSKADLPFEKRYEHYCWAVKQLNLMGYPEIKSVVQNRTSNAVQIQNIYETAVEAGYEGWVGKRVDAPYKLGRSTKNQGYFVRGKPEETYDGVVLQINERMENLCESEVNELGYLKKKQDKDAKAHTGMAQTALVMCPNLPKPIKVVLSKGLTDQDRIEIWNNRSNHIGKCLKFTAMPVKGQELPRSPRFLDWRGDIEPIYLQHDGTGDLLVSFDWSEVEAMNQSDIVDPNSQDIWFQKALEQGLITG